MNAQHFDILIIGAGLSGIGTACQVSAEHPNKTIAVLERRERLGGTWDLFRYPGIRSDSDMYSFGYKFRPWQELKVLADGAVDPPVHRRHRRRVRHRREDPLRRQGRHRGLLDHREPLDRRRPCTRRADANLHRRLPRQLHRLLQLRRRIPADFPGWSSSGSIVHPQHWPEDLDYTGKKVVVIGSGATAMTLVPAMAGNGAHITMLQRSPSYIFSVPALDKISEVLGRFLPANRVHKFARKRNIAIQRYLYLACKRWPAKVAPSSCSGSPQGTFGPSVDMSHFTPKYMPWDQRLCAVPNGDLFKVLDPARRRSSQITSRPSPRKASC